MSGALSDRLVTPAGLEPVADRRPAAVRAWDRFFFTPADPTPLALVRIAVGLLLLWSFGWLGTELSSWLGPNGWADPALVEATMPPSAWSFWLWLPSWLITPVFALGLLAVLALTVGLGSPVAAVLTWLLVIGTNRRIPVIFFGFDGVMAMWTFYLAVTGACGQALSVDRWLGLRTGRLPAGPPVPTVAANLSLRLIQLYLCLIYASAGLAKLQGTPWWDGSAVAMLLGNSEFRPFDLTGLASYPELLQLATHGTIALELLYPSLIWNRGWRPWLLAGAVGMHLAIALSMGLTVFSFAMIAGNLAFVPPAWLHGLARLVRGRGPAPGLESAGGPAAGGDPGRVPERTRPRTPR